MWVLDPKAGPVFGGANRTHEIYENEHFAAGQRIHVIGNLSPISAMGGIVQEQQEKEALRQLKTGNYDALEFLYQLHNKAVYRTAYGITHHRHQAEEATQKLFIGLPAAIKRYDLERPFLPWLYQIAVRRAIDEVRRDKKRRPEIPIDHFDHFHDLPSVSPSPEEEAEQSETKDVLWNAIGKLRPNDRAVVVLRYFDGFTGDEMAEILDCKPGTVRSRLNTALHCLRESLSELDDPPDPPNPLDFVNTAMRPQPRPNGAGSRPGDGSLAESVLPDAKQVERRIGVAGEQSVGREP